MNAHARVIIIFNCASLYQSTCIDSKEPQESRSRGMFVDMLNRSLFWHPAMLEDRGVMRPGLIKELPTQCGATVSPFSTQNLGSGC
jgi:hypothetical protein